VGADVTPLLRGMARRLKHAHPEIWANWPTIVGQEVSSRAVPRSFNGKTLVVAVASSSWLQELSFLKAELLERLADAVGPGVVRDIRLVLDPELGREAG
jgi:predicted nucleic acid-binding Zn ribbon protein